MQHFAVQSGLIVKHAADIAGLVDAFRQSQMYSIDAFLARRPEFTDIGKRAIAAILLDCEASNGLDTLEPDDGWYRYLWNQFAALTWEELDFSNLRIVTFNYDRSLEHYLLMAVKHSHGKSDAEVLSKLETLKVVHVYGVLGGALPGHPNYLNFRSGAAASPVAAQSLQVIPEGRDDNAALVEAREHLLWADRIGFLGFGFDEINMRRLETKKTCARAVTRNGGTLMRPIHATCLGMTDAEVQEAMRRMGNNDHVDPRFYPLDCLKMLRETALLR